MKIQYCCVMCTCPHVLAAQELSKILTEQGLAACVNLIQGVTSFFVWDSTLNADSEVLMLIKTHKDNLVDLEAAIKANHPYDVPEIIALPIIWGSQDYLNWLDENTNQTS